MFKSAMRSLILVVVIWMLVVPAAANRGHAELPAGVSADWWTEVQRSIVVEEYGLVGDRVAEEGYRGANPAQRFEVRFDPRGVRIAPLEGEAWEWSLALAGWGRPGSVAATSAVEVRAEGNRLEIDRGEFTEWFVNSPAGLEHGFTVPVRPIGSSDRLVFDLLLEGGLRPVFSEDGQAVDFRATGNLAVLRYAKLKVTDALGEEVPAWMEPIVGGIRIVADDSGAVYPLTVDPLATASSWNATGEVGSGAFGRSVSTAGDVNGDGYSDVIVGADRYNSYAGKAYLFLGGPAGTSAVASWTALGESTNNRFGVSVATAGDVNGDGYSDVVVGASGYDSSTGKAYLYLGGPSGLAAVPSWTKTGEATADAFGYSVATAGDVDGDGYSDVVIGAYTRETRTGKAYLYRGGTGGLSMTASWTAVGEEQKSAFGRCVATAGDVNGDGYSDVVVGASYYDGSTSGNLFIGKAYLYLGGASGLSPTPAWSQRGESRDNWFGESVATAGDVNRDGYADLLVGAYGNNFGIGKIYLYLGGPTGLPATASWTKVGTGTNSLGFSLATAGDVNGDGYSDVVVGAGTSTLNGEVWVYLGGPTGLPSGASWIKKGAGSSTGFGGSVATAGDVNGDGFSDVIIGDDNFNYSSGQAFVFLGGGDGLSTASSWSPTGEGASNFFGHSIATAGDVNGDGYSDVVVGARGYSSNTGRAYLYLGSGTGLSTTAAWTRTGEAVGQEFGSSVASAGDVNGDGFSDVVVGARGHAGGTGKAFVYHGAPGGLSTSASWTAIGESGGARFGEVVASAGDVNRDGLADLVIGSPGHAGNTGKAYLYRGTASGLSASASWSAVGQGANQYFAAAAGSAGDVDGDGFSDVVVGAYGHATNTGKAYLYRGSVSGLASDPAWTATGQGAAQFFGSSVGTAGDVNGDGYSDVVIGAYGYLTNTGKAYAYLGTPSGLTATPAWTAVGQGTNNYFAYSVATAGDVDGDGFSEVVVGAYGSATFSGRFYLYHGTASGPTTMAASVVTGSGGNFARVVATAGDVNGDGRSDVVVGADGVSTDTGRVYLYLGGGGSRGPAVVPRQLRADESAPIAAGGGTSGPQFRVGLTLYSPAGRVDRTLQWQVGRWGTGFSTSVNPIYSDPGWYDGSVTRTAAASLGNDYWRYAWRARVRYSPAQSPFVPWSPWYTIPGNGRYEADVFRVASTPCTVPAQELYLPTAGRDGSGRAVLHLQDANPAGTVTGYNVYRAFSPTGPWSVLAVNAVDADPATPGVQYVDQTGGTVTWYYKASAYNAVCGAEGPR